MGKRDRVRLIFSKSRSPGSWLIRFFTWSDWSHVGILTASSTIIESVAGEGVREIALAESKVRKGTYAIVEVPSADADAVIAAARSQIGKPYDFSGLYGFVGRRNWQEPDSWFCSELVAWAFSRARQPLFREDSVHRVTPGHLYMLAHEAAPVTAIDFG